MYFSIPHCNPDYPLPYWQITTSPAWKFSGFNAFWTPSIWNVNVLSKPYLYGCYDCGPQTYGCPEVTDSMSLWCHWNIFLNIYFGMYCCQCNIFLITWIGQCGIWGIGSISQMSFIFPSLKWRNHILVIQSVSPSQRHDLPCAPSRYSPTKLGI